MKPELKLLIADDYPINLEGAVTMVHEASDRIRVVGKAYDVESAIKNVELLMPDVVLTDYDFKKALTGIDLITELKSTYPEIKCILMTSHGDDIILLKSLEAGADGFLHKESSARQYIEAIEVTASGITYFPAELRVIQRQWKKKPKPTPAEFNIIPYIAAGLSSKEIAIILNKPSPGMKREISRRTIDQHKANIRQKFQIHDATGSITTFAIKFCNENHINWKIFEPN